MTKADIKYNNGDGFYTGFTKDGVITCGYFSDGKIYDYNPERRGYRDLEETDILMKNATDEEEIKYLNT